MKRLDYKAWDMVKDGRADECPRCVTRHLEYDSEWNAPDDKHIGYTVFYCHGCGFYFRFYYRFDDKHLNSDGFYTSLPVTHVCMVDEDQEG